MSLSEHQAKFFNEFFKSLGEVDEESQKWKEYHESVTKIIQVFYEFIGNKLAIVKPRIYGSTAENLKIYSVDDVGDLDVLLLLEEDFVVDERMLEYLPRNPAFVKIKGAGHPLLQSFLVEGTEYISASEIKGLYPFVDSWTFGVTFLSRILKVATSHFPTPALNSSVRERNTDSPAWTCDLSALMESRDALSRKVEKLKRLNFQNLDASELELIPATLCTFGHVDYTPQHAEVFDDYVQHFKYSLQYLCSNPKGIIQGLPDFVREIWSSEKAQEVRNRFCSVKSGSESENGSKPEGNSTMAVTSEIVGVDENENRLSKCKPVEQQFAEAESEGCVGGGKDGNSHDTFNKLQAERVTKKEIDELTPRQEQKSGFFSQTFQNPAEDEMEAFVDYLLKEKAEDFFNFLDTVEPVKELQFPSSNKSQQCTQSFSIDVVPALQARGWPKVAREWINRKRKWPSPDTLQRIMKGGFHIVVKPPKSTGCSETDFRLSFSHAEYLLSQELNDIQRQCYRGLKKYYRLCLRTEPKCLTTYHLKTLFFQTCEETGPEIWTEENRTICMMTLLGKLSNSMQHRCLRHFFVIECNLLDVENIENPHTLDLLAEKVDQFTKNPLAFSPELIPDQEITKRPDEMPFNRSGEEATTINGEFAEASIEETLPRNYPKRGGLPVTTNEENKDSSSQEQSMTKMTSTAKKETARMNNSPETLSRMMPLEGVRFHDLKAQHTKICLKLLTTAVEDGDIEELDPLERTLVGDIKELISVYSVSPEKLLGQFEKRWQATYAWMCGNCEVYTKQSMLDAMKNTMKVIKHAILQDGFLGSPRDFSLLAPRQFLVSYYRRWKRVLDSMETKQPTAEVQDDIPLD